MNMKMNRKKAFTLVELMLVVLILGVLASIVVPRVTESAGDAKKAKCAANEANLIRALELYSVKNGGVYPKNQKDFDRRILRSRTYFPHGRPTCPYNAKKKYVYDARRKTIRPHKHK